MLVNVGHASYSKNKTTKKDRVNAKSDIGVDATPSQPDDGYLINQNQDDVGESVKHKEKTSNKVARPGQRKMLSPGQLAALKRQRIEFQEMEIELRNFEVMKEDLYVVRLRLWVLQGVIDYGLPEETLDFISRTF